MSNRNELHYNILEADCMQSIHHGSTLIYPISYAGLLHGGFRSGVFHRPGLEVSITEAFIVVHIMQASMKTSMMDKSITEAAITMNSYRTSNDCLQGGGLFHDRCFHRRLPWMLSGGFSTVFGIVIIEHTKWLHTYNCHVHPAPADRCFVLYFLIFTFFCFSYRILINREW